MTDERPLDRCGECGFDGADYTVDDLAGTLRAVGTWWRLLTDPVTPDVLVARPSPSTWSAAEYALHSSMVTAMLGAGLHRVVTGADLPATSDLPPDAAADDALLEIDVVATIGSLDASAQRIARKLVGLDADALARTAAQGDDRVSARWVAAHAVHDALHHLVDVGRGLHALGATPALGDGQVAGLFTSGGGVPKRPVDGVEIGHRGLVGDRQKTRKHHGRVWQAVCLWSVEVVEGFAADGHPIALGSAGENVSVRGLDWPVMRPGVRLRVGEALLEVTVPAIPCVHNAQWFADRDISRIHHEQGTSSRWYARVVAGGAVAGGDAVVVEPA